MTQRTMTSRVSNKHDIEANWLKAVNFIPLDGELIIYDKDENHSQIRIKFGDGVTPVSELEFYGGADLEDLIGKATENGGEIFNDYENNKANTEYSHAEGLMTVTGATGYNIGSIIDGLNELTKILIVEEDVTESGYAVGDTVTLLLDKYYYDKFKIVDISITNGLSNITISNIDDVTPMPTLTLYSDPEENWIYAFYLGTGNPKEQLRVTPHPIPWHWAAHIEGRLNQAYGQGAHAEGGRNFVQGDYTHAEGCLNRVTNDVGHAEGWGTTAGYQAHSEGNSTKATGWFSHAEGHTSVARSDAAHAEGSGTVADKYAHSEGQKTQALGQASHSEGSSTKALGKNAHAEGDTTEASGESSHTEGNGTKATALAAHAEGRNSEATGIGSHAEGGDGTAKSIANGVASHAENAGKAYGDFAHAEGSSQAKGSYSHAEGSGNIAEGQGAHAEGGNGTYAKGTYAHAEGRGSQALGSDSHSEGSGTIASQNQSHAEGSNTTANGYHSHAEGSSSNKKNSVTTSVTVSDILVAWQEKKFSYVAGTGAHGEGVNTLSLGRGSHSEGVETIAAMEASSASGKGTVANTVGQAVVGTYNEKDTDAVFIAGNGTSDTNRSNAFKVMKSGSIEFSGFKAVESENLFKNSNFAEVGANNIPTNWVLRNSSNNSDLTNYQITTSDKDGDGRLECEIYGEQGSSLVSGVGAYLGQSLSLEPNTIYGIYIETLEGYSSNYETSIAGNCFSLIINNQEIYKQLAREYGPLEAFKEGEGYEGEPYGSYSYQVSCYNKWIFFTTNSNTNVDIRFDFKLTNYDATFMLEGLKLFKVNPTLLFENLNDFVGLPRINETSEDKILQVKEGKIILSKQNVTPITLTCNEYVVSGSYINFPANIDYDKRYNMSLQWHLKTTTGLTESKTSQNKYFDDVSVTWVGQDQFGADQNTYYLCACIYDDETVQDGVNIYKDKFYDGTKLIDKKGWVAAQCVTGSSDTECKYTVVICEI